jgi:hypothetical protein
MVIQLKKDLVGWATTEDGEALFSLLLPSIQNGGPVTVDFAGINAVSSSFVNSAFVALRDRVGYDHLSKHLRMLNLHPSVAALLRRRLMQQKSSQPEAPVG